MVGTYRCGCPVLGIDGSPVCGLRSPDRWRSEILVKGKIMASAPKWKVYSRGDYLAACKDLSDALALCDKNGDGSSIRHGHAKSSTVWTQGDEAVDSLDYDTVIEIIHNRMGD